MPRGFTLLELMVSVGLLGFLLAMAFPSFQTMRLAQELATAEQDVASTLVRARWSAITSGERRTVDFRDPGAIRIFDPRGALVLSASVLDNSVTLASSVETFDFDGRGFVPGAASITIELTNPGAVVETVTVSRVGKIETR